MVNSQPQNDTPPPTGLSIQAQPARSIGNANLPGQLRAFCREFVAFGFKEAQSCLFAGSFFLILFVSSHIPLFGLARYDFLFLAAILIQVVFILLKLESREEMKVIFLFHLIGFILELFKTSPGIASWSYPEPGLLKIGTVPLYSGFMYSAVGSYINLAWKIFRLRYEQFPPIALLALLSLGIYLNFFTHHFAPDIRWWLIAGIFLLFRKTQVYFTVLQDTAPRKMPLSLAFMLIGFFIWVAENISTYLGAWRYPDQLHQWAMVSPQKISCWFLLVIVSFNIVALLHRKHLQPEPPA